MPKKNEQTIEQVVEQVAVETKVDETKALITKITSDTTTNVSQKIRALAAAGLKMGPITKALTESGYKTKNGTPIRFQHVRNVLNTQPKKAG